MFTQQANGFFHRYANRAWKVKGIKNLHHSILCTFYKQRVLVTLQHAQVASILRHAIIEEGPSMLSVLSRGSLVSLFDLLLVTGRVSKTWCSPCHLPFEVVYLFSYTWVLPFCSLYSCFFLVLWFFLWLGVSSLFV